MCKINNLSANIPVNIYNFFLGFKSKSKKSLIKGFFSKTNFQSPNQSVPVITTTKMTDRSVAATFSKIPISFDDTFFLE